MLNTHAKQLEEFRKELDGMTKQKAIDAMIQTKLSAIVLREELAEVNENLKLEKQLVRAYELEIDNLKHQLVEGHKVQARISSRLHHYRNKLHDEIDDSAGLATLLDRARESKTDCEGPRQ